MFRHVQGLSKCVFGCGLLFLLAPAALASGRTFTVLHDFAGGTDGAEPESTVVADAEGDLYGTTFEGGSDIKCARHVIGCGTVYELAPDGTETVLHTFAGGTDGANPSGPLVIDKEGNLYGTTTYGGIDNCGPRCGYGTIFEITSSGMMILHVFRGSDGDDPQGGLLRDKKGNLYGTTLSNVFKLSPHGKLAVLYTFAHGSDGANPNGGLIADGEGNLYGTTIYGGSVNGGCNYGNGCGTVFKVTPEGNETVLYAFTGGSDGSEPRAGVVADEDGNLYGTTVQGGSNSACINTYGCGVVFELSTDGTETVLHSFGGEGDGAYPLAGLIRDKAGNLYGTTSGGGVSNFGHGAIFKLASNGTNTVLHALSGHEGAAPYAGLFRDKTGSFYGTASRNGTGHKGTIFKLSK